MAPISDIERQVFTDIYETYSGKLYGVCLHYVHDHAIAEDLLHDSFIVIFSSLGNLRDPARLEPWMCSIVRNIALKHLRQVQKMPGTSIDNIPEPPFEDNVVNITEIPLDELLKVIDDLPEQYGNVFRLSVLEGLSHKEIGAILGIAPHSSSSNLARAKQLLRSVISRNWGIILTFCLCIFAVLFMARPEKTETMTADNQVNRITDTENPEVMIAELSPAKAIKPLARRNSMVITEHSNEDIDIQENGNNLEEPDMSGSDNVAISGTEPGNVTETLGYDDIFEPEDIRRKAGKTFRFSFSGTVGNSMNGMQMVQVPGSGTPGYESGFRPPGTGGDITSSVDSLRQSKAIAASEESGNGHSTLIRKYRHSMPVSFTANATWMITDRWMLSSGLRYTYLHSDVTQGIRTYDQEIHYLGIPLKASWTFWKAASFNAYTSGGVSFEIPLGGHLGSERLDLSCQWSAGISVGLQYNITPHVGIYIEPELYRYFDNGSHVQTIRTERPLNFNLPAGIRFSW
ncbi:MAG: sigma-70 family RNA polymerase sigma factor [Bacteroidales bacterium]|nr:sigma-70 family RNA polymerase sigma factor [Bacteroidales bacterium]